MERRDVERYLEWLYTGCVSEQHAERLFVLADRMSDTSEAACSSHPHQFVGFVCARAGERLVSLRVNAV